MRYFFGTAILLAFSTLPLLFASQNKANTAQPKKDDSAKPAQSKPIVALRLEATDEHGSARITVFLENLTDKPIKLRDSASPAFSPWPCLKAKVDGKEADLQARAAFAQFFDKAEERTIDAKKRFKLGDVLVTAKGSRLEKDEPLVPVLYVAPGTHTIQLSLKRDEGTLGIRGTVSPASIKVKVISAKDNGSAKGDRLGKPVAVEVDGKPLAAAGSPFFGDFDGDGLPDLLLGYGGDGRLQIYRNVGTKTVPRLTGPRWFDDRVPTGRVPKG